MFSLFFAKGPYVEDEPHEALRHDIVRIQVKFLKYQLDLCEQRLKREPGNRDVLLKHLAYRKQLMELGE